MSVDLDRQMRALAERYRLSDLAVRQLQSLLSLLVNDRHAPTAVRDRSKAINDHLADSLVALDLAQVRSASAIADLGSGAGLPGLPLAIALPAADLALVESAARRCAFLERAVHECGIANARVVHARIESWGGGSCRFDVVAARALGPLEVVVEYAAPLLRVGGTLVAWRGRRDPGAESAARRAAGVVGLEEVEVRPVRPYPEAEHRCLYLMSKVRETPEGFPRRPGMALKRPLGTRSPVRHERSDRSRR